LKSFYSKFIDKAIDLIILIKRQFHKEHFKAFVVEFYLKLNLILRIISYLTYICWEIDNFEIKSDIFIGDSSSNIEADRSGFLRVRKGVEGALINIHRNEGAQGC
jgi:hypothetical protein